MTDIDSSAGTLVPPSSSFSVTNSQLSPGIAYYLRRLLRKNLDQLVTADASPLSALMLHDIEALARGAAGAEVAATMGQLDDLAQQHRSALRGPHHQPGVCGSGDCHSGALHVRGQLAGRQAENTG